MNTTRKTFILIILAALTAPLLSACQANITRNPDGSLRVETTMTEAALQTEIQVAIADTQFENLTVDLQPGYMLVSGVRQRLYSDQTDTLTFRLDLGAQDGLLTAVVSDAKINGEPVDVARVALWNERIANRLTRFGNNHPRSTLQSVTVTSDAVTMVWRVETGRSK